MTDLQREVNLRTASSVSLLAISVNPSQRAANFLSVTLRRSTTCSLRDLNPSTMTGALVLFLTITSTNSANSFFSSASACSLAFFSSASNFSWATNCSTFSTQKRLMRTSSLASSEASTIAADFSSSVSRMMSITIGFFSIGGSRAASAMASLRSFSCLILRWTRLPLPVSDWSATVVVLKASAPASRSWCQVDFLFIPALAIARALNATWAFALDFSAAILRLATTEIMRDRSSTAVLMSLCLSFISSMRMYCSLNVVLLTRRVSCLMQQGERRLFHSLKILRCSCSAFSTLSLVFLSRKSLHTLEMIGTAEA